MECITFFDHYRIIVEILNLCGGKIYFHFYQPYGYGNEFCWKSRDWLILHFVTPYTCMVLILNLNLTVSFMHGFDFQMKKIK